ncbi:MAG: DUF1501 domain-containing protein [Verrucomicrobia bacterium]|nr:MAG: DUF1501 domain-containing protein [Verrucomicrobiota bacterium]
MNRRNPWTAPGTRRAMLRDTALGFGQLALATLMAGRAMSAPPSPLAGHPPHFAPRARRIIFLFMHGGPSHVDTFDHKPLLERDTGKPLPFAKPRVQFAKTGNLRRSPWEFRRRGQSGATVSELFPLVGGCADDLCFLKAVHGTNEAHGGALLKLHTGSDVSVRPSMGSWISYGLGTENANLPSFLTINPTLGHGGVGNWSSAFLPAAHQGTPLGASGIPVERATIANLKGAWDPEVQRAQLDLLGESQRDHLALAGHDPALEARIQSFELAFRMQTEAPEILGLDGETEATRRLYGLDDPRTASFARQCLLARRFSERGVRFVQASHGYWDQHEDLTRDHGRLAGEVDRPIAGLLRDLKARGLLDETLVLWGGEFGRTPTGQGTDGRDHHPHAFTMWMAGGGVRPGMSFGQTDDYGFYGVADKVHVHDLHATILALLGLDHERLTYRHAGRDYRLTDVAGRVVREIMRDA